MTSFEPNAPGYSHNNALLLAKTSKLAYLQRDIVETELQKWNLNNIYHFDHRETQAFIAGNDKLVILSFRGTEPGNLRDWMTSVNMTMVEGYGGRVHRGFSRALEDIWSDIVKQINLFHDKNQPIFLTGHSLGGSLASMTAVRLGDKYEKYIRGLYTYGSPRVGDRGFVNNYDKLFSSRTFRFINHRDVVTRLGPRSLGYRHVNSCYYFDSIGQLHIDTKYWQKFLKTVQGTPEEFLNLASLINDHNLDEYEQNIFLNLSESLTQKICLQSLIKNIATNKQVSKV